MKIVFSTGKGTKIDMERSDSLSFQDERNSLDGTNKQLINSLFKVNKL